MKKSICFLFMLVIIISCNDSGRVCQKMDYIKEVGDTNPTFAKVILDSLELKVRQMPKDVRMKYDLLSIRLDDKADVIPVSDIKIKEILSYYINEGDIREKQEAYYYAASVYRDLNDTPMAMEYFLESIKIAENNTSVDLKMLRNAYSNLTYLYSNVQDYSHAYKMAQNEYRIAKEIGALTIESISHLGETYMSNDSVELAKPKFKEALHMYKQSEANRNVLLHLLMNMSNLKMNEAHECYRLLCDMGFQENDFTEKNALGSYYEFINHTDSAIICYKYILDNSDYILDLYDASRGLFRLFQEKGDEVTANYYAKKMIEIDEKYNMGERQEIAATTNNRFQYHRDKEEERRVKEEKNWYMLLSVVSGISLLLCVAVFMAFYTHKRNKHLKRALEVANEMNAIRADNEGMAMELQHKEDELAVTKQNLSSTKDKLVNLNSELEKYNRELEEKEKLLEGKIEQNKSLIRMLSLSETESAAEEIIYRIRKASEGQYAMKPKDWRGLYHAVDELYPDFRDSIARNLGNFSDQEMQVCYLMRAGLSNHQIQNVLQMSRATIWRWTKRMHWISRP